MNLNAFGEGLVTIVLAVVGLAIIATLVGKNARTSAVLGAATHGLAQDISAAEAPVTGGGGFGAFPSSFGSADLSTLLGS